MRTLPELKESPNVSVNKQTGIQSMASKLKSSLGKYMIHFNPKFPFLMSEDDIKFHFEQHKLLENDLSNEITLLNKRR